MKFEAKPHTIEAFRFTKNMPPPPKWFMDEYTNGQAMVTVNAKEQYIAVASKCGMHKAFWGDWVCRNQSGTMFVLSDDEIKRGFREYKK